MNEPSDEEMAEALSGLPDYAASTEEEQAAARDLVRHIIRLRVEKGYTREQVQALLDEAGARVRLISSEEPNRWQVKDDDGRLH
jgi:hypothetical protein